MQHSGHVDADGLRTLGSGQQGLWKSDLHDTAAQHARPLCLTFDTQTLALRRESDGPQHCPGLDRRDP